MAQPGMSITKSDITSLSNKYKAAASRLAHYKQQADTAARQVVHGIEAGGTAFLLGLGNGYYVNGFEVMGVPIDLLVAGGSLGLSFALEEDLAPHLRAVSTGATCAYATTMGYSAGTRLREKKQLEAAGAPGGNLANQVPAAP